MANQGDTVVRKQHDGHSRLASQPFDTTGQPRPSPGNYATTRNLRAPHTPCRNRPHRNPRRLICSRRTRRNRGLKLTSRYSNLNRRRRRESQTLTGHLGRTARLLDVAIRNCIVAGDSVWDLLAAVRQSAFRVGFLSGGYGRGRTGHTGALRVFSDAADRLMHIERLGLPGK